MPETHPRFLVIRLSSIGDIVHALPAVAALGRSIAGAEIHWAIEGRYAGLLRGNPFVRHVIELDTLGWRKAPRSGSALAALARLGLRMREFAYDAAIDLQGLFKTGFLARLSRSERRIGFAERWLREPPAAVFYTERVAPEGRRHVVELNLALAESLGARASAWEFPLPKSAEDESAIEERLRQMDVRDFIIVNPGGGWKSKRWPPESYSELTRRLDDQSGFAILLTGSPDEEAMIREILAGAAARRAFYFPSTISQFIALARRAKLFIGGDTGPMHLAAAVGAPIVAIFDASERLNTPERNGPFHPADITLTQPESALRIRNEKNRDYLRGVPVYSVLAAARERWKRAYG